jgi:hypothetical protein
MHGLLLLLLQGESSGSPAEAPALHAVVVSGIYCLLNELLLAQQQHQRQQGPSMSMREASIRQPPAGPVKARCHKTSALLLLQPLMMLGG